jgi:hypothetical protein
MLSRVPVFVKQKAAIPGLPFFSGEALPDAVYTPLPFA